MSGGVITFSVLELEEEELRSGFFSFFSLERGGNSSSYTSGLFQLTATSYKVRPRAFEGTSLLFIALLLLLLLLEVKALEVVDMVGVEEKVFKSSVEKMSVVKNCGVVSIRMSRMVRKLVSGELSTIFPGFYTKIC